MKKFQIALECGLINEIVKLFATIAAVINLIMYFTLSIFIITLLICFICIILLEIISLLKIIKNYKDLLKVLAIKQFALKTFSEFLEWKKAHPNIDDEYYFENIMKKKLENDKNV